MRLVRRDSSRGHLITESPVRISRTEWLWPINGVRSGGVILVVHEDDPSIVAAVTVTGSGAFRSWNWQDGKWR